MTRAKSVDYRLSSEVSGCIQGADVHLSSRTTSTLTRAVLPKQTRYDSGLGSSSLEAKQQNTGNRGQDLCYGKTRYVEPGTDFLSMALNFSLFRPSRQAGTWTKQDRHGPVTGPDQRHTRNGARAGTPNTKNGRQQNPEQETDQPGLKKAFTKRHIGPRARIRAPPGVPRGKKVEYAARNTGGGSVNWERHFHGETKIGDETVPRGHNGWGGTPNASGGNTAAERHITLLRGGPPRVGGQQECCGDIIRGPQHHERNTKGRVSHGSEKYHDGENP